MNTAHAVYARAALTRQDYATALAQAKLAEVNRPLMNRSEYAGGFYKPTKEWIFGSYGGDIRAVMVLGFWCIRCL